MIKHPGVFLILRKKKLLFKKTITGRKDHIIEQGFICTQNL